MSPSQDESNAANAANREAEIAMLLNVILPVWLKQLDSVKNQTEEAVSLLINSVSSLIALLDQTDTQTRQIVKHDVDNLLLRLQYQDRINQTLSVIMDDMARLQSLLANGNAKLPAIEDWLNQLNSRYTMSNERIQHLRAIDNHPTCGIKPNPDDEVTFF